jgi:hypothetical protein
MTNIVDHPIARSLDPEEQAVIDNLGEQWVARRPWPVFDYVNWMLARRVGADATETMSRLPVARGSNSPVTYPARVHRAMRYLPGVGSARRTDVVDAGNRLIGSGDLGDRATEVLRDHFFVGIEAMELRAKVAVGEMVES